MRALFLAAGSPSACVQSTQDGKQVNPWKGPQQVIDRDVVNIYPHQLHVG